MTKHDPIDVHVGAAIASRRVALGRTQSDLGRALGVTFQQVQKYEKGANRVSASMMFRAAAYLRCTPADFFPDQDGTAVGPGETDPCLRLGAVSGGHDLAEGFIRMASDQRASVLNIVRAIVAPLQAAA